MDGSEVWLRSFETQSGAEERVCESLAEAGVTPRRSTGDLPPPGAGVVLIGRMTPGLYGWVSQASRSGQERVLAVGATGCDELEAESWRLLAAGASDVFAWDRVTDPAELIAARLRRWREIDRLTASAAVSGQLVGIAPALRAVSRQLVEIARFSAAPVLVEGETGTGKEVAARLIHQLDDRRATAELVVVDCSTIVADLSGSELFGHERGAFTHAVAARDGAVALADGGTLFLDEVGELPPRQQAELLRTLQEKTFKRVGSNAWRQSDFRLVCATNRDLEAAVESGAFRRDLFHRIAAWRCRMPPLAERREDVSLLVRHFLAAAEAHRATRDDLEVDPALLAVLVSRDYPGNVRELKNLVERIAGRHPGGATITVGDLPEDERPPADGPAADWRDAGFRGALRLALSRRVGLKEIGSAAAEAAVEIAVGEAEGNLQRAAERLGVTPRALQLRRAARLRAD
jgi:transcriptional regulator with GAF, ATPase, and Fis domain